MTMLTERTPDVADYLRRTCIDYEQEAIPERDPGYRLTAAYDACPGVERRQNRLTSPRLEDASHEA